MVLSGFGLDVPEEDLRLLCEADGLGTNLAKVVVVAQQLGFDRTARATLSLDRLPGLVAKRLYPIVLTDQYLLDGIKGTHALVVTDINEKVVIVYDPLHGERLLPLNVFSAAWSLHRNLAIVIDK